MKEREAGGQEGRERDKERKERKRKEERKKKKEEEKSLQNYFYWYEKTWEYSKNVYISDACRYRSWRLFWNTICTFLWEIFQGIEFE